jgi:hypothetical protein
MGPLFLAPGPKTSCGVLYTHVGTLASCRANRYLVRGQLSLAFRESADRMLIYALLPDGARRLGLRLKGRARGFARLRGNAAIAYTSSRLYRGGTLRWVDRAGRSRTTKLPFPE